MITYQLSECKVIFYFNQNFNELVNSNLRFVIDVENIYFIIYLYLKQLFKIQNKV